MAFTGTEALIQANSAFEDTKAVIVAKADGGCFYRNNVSFPGYWRRYEWIAEAVVSDPIEGDNVALGCK